MALSGGAGSARADDGAASETVTVTGDAVHLLATGTSDTALGLAKPLVETPRAVTLVSDTTIARYGISGLDDLTVGQSAAGATTVGAGKYLTNKVYIQGNAGADQKSSNVTVQYELTPHFKLQSTTGQAQTGGGVLWQYDY